VATFDTDPTSDITVTGWTETSDSVWEDLTSGSDGDESTVDDNGNAATFGGVTLPADFPAAGADSVTYSLRMRIQSDKPDPDPDMRFQILTSGNVEIAVVTVSLGSSPTAFTTYTGSMTISGNNTDTGWTGHRLRLTPIKNDSTRDTDFEVSDLDATVTYTVSGGTTAGFHLIRGDIIKTKLRGLVR